MITLGELTSMAGKPLCSIAYICICIYTYIINIYIYIFKQKQAIFQPAMPGNVRFMVTSSMIRIPRVKVAGWLMDFHNDTIIPKIP